MKSLPKLVLSELFSVYGNVLTEKQRDAVQLYCDCDCSLSEIADDVGISRQGVRAAIVGAEKVLTQLEAQLHIAEMKRKYNRLSDEIVSALDGGDYAQARIAALQLAWKE